MLNSTVNHTILHVTVGFDGQITESTKTFFNGTMLRVEIRRVLSANK